MTRQLAKPEKAPAPLPKESLAYWYERVHRPVGQTRKGRIYIGKNWAIEFRYNGERHNWSLHTEDRKAAAYDAREMYFFLIQHGWKDTKIKYGRS